MHHHHSKLDFYIRKLLHILERIIALIILGFLVSSLIAELIHIFGDPSVLQDVNHFLHNILTIVVGLEFVRMMIDTTPANILEVLTVAITRHVVLSHEDPWSTLACIACIGGLFAIRRFLIPRAELKEEMVEIE
jgi:chromate transport protein ChrA